MFNPPHLTDENINWFRNRSSHDAAVPLVDASVGRVLAKRVLDGFFAPLADQWGFTKTLLAHNDIAVKVLQRPVSD